MQKRMKVLFSGDIRGTGSRFFIKQKALELGLKGYCLLNEQHQLEVEVEGRMVAIEEFLRFVEKGVSPQATQTKFTIELFDELKGYKRMKSDIV